MKEISRSCFTCLCLLFFVSVLYSSERPVVAKTQAAAATQARMHAAYGRLPLRFEANRGQAEASVKFLSRSNGHTLFLTSTEAVLTLDADPPCTPDLRKDPRGCKASPRAGGAKAGALRMRLIGSNSAAEVAGRDELPGRSNYLVGGDPARWHTNIPAYGRVEYRGVYPGIDLTYYGNQRQVEYDFVLSPGADARRIRLAMGGADSVKVDEGGDLVLSVAGKEVRFRKPSIYQPSGTGRRVIAGRYALAGHNEVGFALGAYDRSRPLVIDPVLAYSTFLGGAGDERNYAIAVDSAGNAYVGGRVSNDTMPVVGAPPAPNGGGYDGFVTKVSADGSTVLFTTILGGSAYDAVQGLAVDSVGNVFATGTTASSDFPAVNPFWAFNGTFDAFVTKLSANGSGIVYSTVFGSSGTSVGFGIAVDGPGNAYVTGYTNSTGFPIFNARQQAIGGDYDAFITKVDPDGGLLYSTFLGGTAEDVGFAIAVDSSGAVYVTGSTKSTDFPTAGPIQATTGGADDVFVSKQSANGATLVYSTYLGGNSIDSGQAIAVDSSGNAYIAGFTSSVKTVITGTTNFPTATPLQAANGGGVDAFVAKVNTAGSALVYSTYLGGSGDDFAYGLVLDGGANAYIAGYTNSKNFPASNAFQGANAGGNDAFVAELNAAGSALVFSSYLGGSDNDYGFGIARDPAGSVYVAGYTKSTDFPTANALQPVFSGSADGFVAKIVQAAVPAINTGGLVNAASFSAPVAAGGMASLFGTGLAVTTAKGTVLPLPLSLAGTSVTVNNVAAPLFFVSTTQINFQVPWEAQGQGQLSVIVTTPGGTSNVLTVAGASFAPGLFSLDSSGSGQGMVQIANTALLVAPVGSVPGAQSRPAKAGEFVSIFCTGLGPVNNHPATGAAAGAIALPTATSPTVTIGGLNAPLQFSGLAPGFVGAYQVNVQVPANVATGNSVAVVLMIGGATSNTVTIAVQ